MADVANQPQLVPREWVERLHQNRSFLTISYVFAIVVAVVLAQTNIEMLDALSSRALANFSPRNQELLNAAELVNVSVGQSIAARISRPITVQSQYLESPESAVRQESPALDQEFSGTDFMRNYTVRPGDTVWGLSQQLGLKAETILWTNPEIDESTAHLSVGDKLVFPSTDGVLHTVSSGDTLADIAYIYEVGIDEIFGFAPNQLRNNIIVPGQELFIPGGIRPPPPAESSITYSAGFVPELFVGTNTFQSPVRDAYVSQGYWANHRALDYAGRTGTPIRAVDRGIVAYANFGWNHGYGSLVVVDHGNGYTSLYAHLSTIAVRKGNPVKQGQVIGSMGNTGNSTGPHLHLEIRKDSRSLNPSLLLN